MMGKYGNNLEEMKKKTTLFGVFDLSWLTNCLWEDESYWFLDSRGEYVEGANVIALV